MALKRAAKAKRSKDSEEYKRFLETARKLEASEASGEFDRAFKRVVTSKHSKESSE